MKEEGLMVVLDGNENSLLSNERVDEILPLPFFKALSDAPWPGLCFIIVYLELKTHGLYGDPKYPGVQLYFLLLKVYCVLDCVCVGFLSCSRSALGY
jgi:hypothetical protein